MARLIRVFALMILSVVAGGSVQSAMALEKPELDCKVGPSMEVFAATDWLAYSCDQPGYVIIVTAPGNPAMPFYFMLIREQDGVRITGEGNGDKSVTAAVVEELKLLSLEDFDKLVARTIEKHE